MREFPSPAGSPQTLRAGSAANFPFARTGARVGVALQPGARVEKRFERSRPRQETCLLEEESLRVGAQGPPRRDRSCWTQHPCCTHRAADLKTGGPRYPRREIAQCGEWPPDWTPRRLRLRGARRRRWRAPTSTSSFPRMAWVQPCTATASKCTCSGPPRALRAKAGWKAASFKSPSARRRPWWANSTAGRVTTT